MVPDAETLETLLKEFRETKKLIIPMKIGAIAGSLILQHESVWKTEKATDSGLLIAYTGGGCMFYDGSSPLNVFKLLLGGFSIHIASSVCALFNALLQFGNQALPHTTSINSENEPNVSSSTIPSTRARSQRRKSPVGTGTTQCRNSSPARDERAGRFRGQGTDEVLPKKRRNRRRADS